MKEHNGMFAEPVCLLAAVTVTAVLGPPGMGMMTLLPSLVGKLTEPKSEEPTNIC